MTKSVACYVEVPVVDPSGVSCTRHSGYLANVPGLASSHTLSGSRCFEGRECWSDINGYCDKGVCFILNQYDTVLLG